MKGLAVCPRSGESSICQPRLFLFPASDARWGEERLPGVTTSSPRPSPSKEEREIKPSAGGSGKMCPPDPQSENSAGFARIGPGMVSMEVKTAYDEAKEFGA
jgi:hypothetical protein